VPGGRGPVPTTEAWRRTEAALPVGWTLEGLRCASEGLAVEQRSDDWIAVALGPDGQERHSPAADTVAALEGLIVAIR
jgi:hypothetical protein